MVCPLLDCWAGALALIQVVTGLLLPEAARPLSGTRPPFERPSVTAGSPAPRLFGPEVARLRAAPCSACMLWIAWLARASALALCLAMVAACCAAAFAAPSAPVGGADARAKPPCTPRAA